jgi:hypothetical protein
VLAWRAIALSLVLLSACSTPAPAPAPTSDPFGVVSERAAQRLRDAQTLTEQGRYVEALSAYRDARLFDPSRNAETDTAIATLEAILTPTALPRAEEPTPAPLPAAPARTGGTPQATAGPGAAPTSAAGAQQSAPPVATATPVPGVATSIIVAGEPVALDAGLGGGQVFVADKSGLVWTLIGGRPTLSRPFTVPGEPTGLAVDDRRMYVALRAGALAIVDIDTGGVLSTVQLPAEPGEVQVDAALRRAYIVLPSQSALLTMDLASPDQVKVAEDLPGISGVAVDRDAHRAFLAHADGRLSVVDGQTGDIASRVQLSEPGLASLAVARGLAFAINTPAHQLMVFDPASGAITRAALAGEPHAIGVGGPGGGVYVLLGGDGAIVHLDPGNGRELDRILLRDRLGPPAKLLVSPLDERVYVIQPTAHLLAIGPRPSGGD